MKEFWNVVQATFAAVGGWLGHYLGGVDGLVYVLVAFVALDYVTGVLCAIADRELSSEVGFKGLVRKVLIFALVGVGQLVDTYIVGQGSVLRTAVIFFYLSNEGLSLVENAAHLGLPVPEQLKEVLVQLHRRGEKEVKMDPERETELRADPDREKEADLGTDLGTDLESVLDDEKEGDDE